MMDVSVIVVNYNTKQLTQNCIDSIFRQTKDVDFEVILVDNASEDGSKDTFEDDPRINYIFNDNNLGFGKANNLGYKHSCGKYVFLLNSDTILVNNAIKLFYDEMEKRSPNIACMGCFLQDVNGKRIHSFGRFPTLGNELVRQPLRFLRRIKWIKELSDGLPIGKIDNHCLLVEYVTGADLFIRRNVVDECRLFDPDFFMYYEETEMQYRYRQHGYKSCIVDSPKIIHLEGASYDKNRDAWKGKSIAGLMTCFRKLYGERRCKLLKLLLISATLPKAIFDYRFPFREKADYFWKIIVA